MKKHLNSKERTIILREMTKEQRNILSTVISKSYRSYFADILSKFKGTRDWCFYKYIDHGRVRKNVTCLCGKHLRNQYILINRKTKEKRTLGKTHFIEELNIPEDIASEVLKGIHDIDYDLDEILIKFSQGWELPEFIKENLPKINVPKDIQRMLDMNLPLLLRQLEELYTFIKNLRTKRKTHLIYSLPLSGGGTSQYSVNNREIYDVLTEKIEPLSYLDTYQKDIERFLASTGKFTPIYDVISYLVEVGLPNELIYGQHALTKYIRHYLDNRKNIKGTTKDCGFTYYKLVK
jgi:hypothetical protein